jgi:hypothetical protein
MNMIRKLPVLAATLAAAATLGAGGMILSAGAAPAHASVRPAVAPAARPNTTLSISNTGVLAGTTNKHNVSCVLKNASTGAGVNGAVIDLDRNGQPDHTGTTSDGGIVNFTVTVNGGTSATFQCLFPGNNSFVSSTSRVITVTTP